MIARLNRRTLFSGILALGVLAVGLVSQYGQQVTAAPQAAAAVNPFHGTYKGGYWGTIPGIGPYGGDVAATISTAGKATVTLPGTGAGSVSSTGAYNVTGKLTVKGVAVAVTYTGKLVATKHPTTGAYLSVVGSGTWKTTSPPANGKWLIQRTATTP